MRECRPARRYLGMKHAYVDSAQADINGIDRRVSVEVAVPVTEPTPTEILPEAPDVGAFVPCGPT